MGLVRYPAFHAHNQTADARPVYGDNEKRVLNLAAFEDAWTEIRSWPNYAATPLVELPGLAGELGLAHLFQKDEGKRFELMSFKALGGAYAVSNLLRQHLREQHGLSAVMSADLLAGRHREHTIQITMASATDGNHGRSVAWGARMFGCRCKIYLHQLVSASRERAIASYGADIIRTVGGYDQSVVQCAADARTNGWQLVADTTAGGSDPMAPSMVMQGYTVMVQEFLDQLPPDRPPSHVFVPGGVGGIAAAVAAHLSERLGNERPQIVVVEPDKADCILRSVASGRLTPVEVRDTFMACLSAGEVSPLAWPLLHSHIDDVLALPDEAAMDAMRRLARGARGDQAIVAGESGAAAMAGVIAAGLDPMLRERLNLNESSIVVSIGSEGATDAEAYQRVVGETAQQIEAAT